MIFAIRDLVFHVIKEDVLIVTMGFVAIRMGEYVLLAIKELVIMEIWGLVLSVIKENVCTGIQLLNLVLLAIKENAAMAIMGLVLSVIKQLAF